MWNHMERGTQPRSPLPMIFKHHLPDDYLFASVLLAPVETGGLRKSRELKKKKDSSCSPVTVVPHNFSSMPSAALASF